MSLRLAELRDVVAELQVLVGARLDKLHAIEPRVLQLVLQKRVLLLSLEPGATRLHLVEAREPGPATPPAWVMKARAELANLPLASVAIVGEDRVVRLGFAGRSVRALVAELFGKSGRLLLLDEAERVLYPLVGAAERGEAYAPPSRDGAADTPRRPSRFPAADPDTLAANRAVAAHYHAALSRERLERLRRDACRPVRARLARARRRLASLEADLARMAGAAQLARQAEALKHGLGLVPRGATRVSLPDPFDPGGPPVEVALDPSVEPVAHMNRLFNRARRLRQALPAGQARRDATRAELQALEAALEALERAPDLAALTALGAEAGPAAASPRARPGQARRLPFKRYLSATGHEILVGRSGRDNHALTFQVARGSDLWLHVRDAASAHVVLRLARDEPPDEASLLDAACLAVHHSPLKDAGKVEVTYTRAKHVHPIKGAPPGLVSVARGKTLLVRVDPTRLARLEQDRARLA